MKDKLRKYLSNIFSWNKLNIWEIRDDAKSSLNKDVNGNDYEKSMVIFFYEILPTIISVLLISLGVFIDDNSSNYFIGGISIFAGMFFSLLFVVVDKLNTKRQIVDEFKLNNKDVPDGLLNYLTRYEIFSEQQVSIISYSIIQCIWLILLMFLCKIIDTYSLEELSKLDYIYYLIYLFKVLINFSTFLLGSKLIILLFVILSNMYVILMQDINSRKI